MDPQEALHGLPVPQRSTHRIFAVLPAAVLDHARAATRRELLIMWALLTWFLVVVMPYLASTPAHVWTNALLFSLLVGTGMNSNAFSAQRGIALREWVVGNPFLVLRFYATPFAVSSYSGVAANDPDSFVAIFPRQSSVLIPACLLVLGVPASMAVVHALLPSSSSERQETTKLLHVAVVEHLSVPPR